MTDPVHSAAVPLLICGTRSLAIEVADLASEIPPFIVEGFVENLDRSIAGIRIEELPVYWIDEVSSLARTHLAVCALATTHRSRFTNEMEGRGFRFATLVHPFSRISGRSSLGHGTIVSAGALIAAHTSVGKHAFINRGALIGHHTRIGDYVSIMPGANIAGKVTVGDATYIGMGSMILDNISVGAHSVVGAGAVVTRDVPDHVQVVGNPARIVKQLLEGK